MVRTTTGQCTFGESTRGVASVTFGVDVIVDGDQASAALPYDDLRGLAMSQEEFFIGEVRRHGLTPLPSTLALVRELHCHGVCTAALSLQRYGTEPLSKAGVARMFDVVLDGLDAPGTHVPEHPDVQMYLQAAGRLHTPPARTAVVEARPLGVAAAREGDFGAVVGVDRTGGSAALAERGANLVIADLCELPVHTRSVA
jgi:beta-phosphoglucomutase-like phosphatase (HAD superfamily)